MKKHHLLESIELYRLKKWTNKINVRIKLLESYLSLPQFVNDNIEINFNEFVEFAIKETKNSELFNSRYLNGKDDSAKWVFKPWQANYIGHLTPPAPVQNPGRGSRWMDTAIEHNPFYLFGSYALDGAEREARITPGPSLMHPFVFVPGVIGTTSCAVGIITSAPVGLAGVISDGVTIGAGRARESLFKRGFFRHPAPQEDKNTKRHHFFKICSSGIDNPAPEQLSSTAVSRMDNMG